MNQGQLRRLRVWQLILWTGCWWPYPYQPGWLANSATLGCVDVAVMIDPSVVVDARGPVIEIFLGNRCEHSVAVDVRRLQVLGRETATGAFVPLTAYDPDHEIDARRIDARRNGEEWIEYHAASAGDVFDALDVDIGQIVDVTSEHRWVHLALARGDAS